MYCIVMSDFDTYVKINNLSEFAPKEPASRTSDFTFYDIDNTALSKNDSDYLLVDSKSDIVMNTSQGETVNVGKETRIALEKPVIPPLQLVTNEPVIYKKEECKKKKWDLTTQFYYGSITVIGLFVLFRLIERSR